MNSRQRRGVCNSFISRHEDSAGTRLKTNMMAMKCEAKTICTYMFLAAVNPRMYTHSIQPNPIPIYSYIFLLQLPLCLGFQSPKGIPVWQKPAIVTFEKPTFGDEEVMNWIICYIFWLFNSWPKIKGNQSQSWPISSMGRLYTYMKTTKNQPSSLVYNRPMDSMGQFS